MLRDHSRWKESTRDSQSNRPSGHHDRVTLKVFEYWSKIILWRPHEWL